jgi:hypothetical protein
MCVVHPVIDVQIELENALFAACDSNQASDPAKMTVAISGLQASFYRPNHIPSRCLSRAF